MNEGLVSLSLFFYFDVSIYIKWRIYFSNKLAMNSICQHCGKTFADKHKLAVHSLNLAKDEIKRHICENSDFQWHLKSMWFMTTMIFFLKILETLWNSQMVNLPKLPTQHLKFLKNSTIFMLTGCLEHLCTERRPWSQLYGTILEKLGLPLHQCLNWGKVPPMVCLLT